MSDLLAISGPRIFDGRDWHGDAALLIEFGHVCGIVSADAVPAHAEVVYLAGGSIVPGFIDLQVNGGGGVLFNNDPSVHAIRTICAAHAQFGTTALLPTLITDTVEVNLAAIAAGKAAVALAVPGFMGLHLEGPHLSLARKGTHDPALIRPMDDSDLVRLTAAGADLPNLLVTVAFAAGASMATHLFNAMSQLGNREPGLVGAVLTNNAVHAGLIADGIHVHPAAIQIALRAKSGPGHIFLVTDAMSQTGTDLTTLTLNGRTITRSGGALRLADGTLAGADLDMIDAVEFMHSHIGLPFDEALRMASLYPAEAMGIADTFGHLSPGAVASFVHLSEDRQVHSTWINGNPVFDRTLSA
jgi:N-acetylglucosamine-6-phosphate deacetylase